MFAHKRSDRVQVRRHHDDTTVDEALHRHSEDRAVQYTHQMSDDTAEASARVLIRAVPLVYGVLLGGLTKNLPLGLSLGIILSMGLDMRMGDKSFFLPLFRPLFERGCPLLAAMAHGLATLIRRAGIPAPSALRNLNCGI